MYTINVLGEETAWAFAPGHTRTVQQLQAALVQHGFPAKLAGRLPGRHAFVRSFRRWLVAQKGGEVNHSTSEYVEHVTCDDRKAITFQVDRAQLVNGTVTYNLYCTVTYHKRGKQAGQVEGSDATIAGLIAADLPNAKEHKKKADMVRLLARVEHYMTGHAIGTMPYGRNLFCPSAQKAMLDRLLAFLADIGGNVLLRQEVVAYALASSATAPAAGPGTPATPPVPQSVSQALSDRLHDAVSDADKLVYELNTTKWTSQKRRERKAAECWDAINAFLTDLNQYHGWLSVQKEIWNDQILSVQQRLTTPDAPPPPEPVKIEYVNDPDDDISVIEVVSTPINAQDDENIAPDEAEARFGGGSGSRLCLFW